MLSTFKLAAEGEGTDHEGGHTEAAGATEAEATGEEALHADEADQERDHLRGQLPQLRRICAGPRRGRTNGLLEATERCQSRTLTLDRPRRQ